MAAHDPEIAQCTIVEGLQARRERHHLSYYVVSDEDMEAFASVVDRLTGT